MRRGYCAGPFASLTVVVWLVPYESVYATVTLVPGRSVRRMDLTSDGAVIVWLSIAVITSPASRPADSAGALGTTEAIAAPEPPRDSTSTPRKDVPPMW